MKTVLKIVTFIVIIIAAVYITRQWFPRERIITVTETTTDTIYNDTTIYKQLPAPDPDTIIETDTIIEYKDSVNYFNEYKYLYKLYYRKNIYNRVLKDDSTAFVKVGDKVTRNQLRQFDFKFIDRTPTVINETITKKIYNQNKIFIGGQIGMHTLQPSVIYQSKKDMMYSVGYDFAAPGGVRAGVYFRLW